MMTQTVNPHVHNEYPQFRDQWVLSQYCQVTSFTQCIP